MLAKKMTVFALAWPIFVEIALFMLMGNVDILMLGRFDQFAVGAVGNANQLFSIIGLLFTMITSATGILIAQSIGAKKEGDIPAIVSLAFFANFTFALILSVIITLYGESILLLINVPLEIAPLAVSYMSIVGGFLFIHAISLTLTTTIRSYGFVKVVMKVSLLTNALNVVGNYIFLFGPFGLPVLGVVGVAISTAFSRFVGFIIYMYIIKRQLNITISFSHVLAWPKALIVKMIKIGIPGAMEPISYQFGQIIIFSMINLFGIVVINTRLYVQTLAWFVYLAVIAIAQALLIVVGHSIGADQPEVAKKIVLKHLYLSNGIALVMSITLALVGPTVLTLFTNDPAIIELARVIFIIDIVVEQGRVFNIILVNATKGAGDVYFPAIMGMISMWVIGVGLAYYLGVYLGLGLVGIWIAFAADEVTRGLVLLARWYSNRWQKYKWV